MSPPRFALVGSACRVSPWLLQALGKIGTLEAVCDTSAESEIVPSPARWVFTDLAAMLREAEPDGIVIDQPPDARTRLIKQCLAAGAGVLLVGPPGTAAACKRLGSFAKVCGKVVLAAPAIRYSPAVLLARRMLESGKLDAPIFMTLQSTWRHSTRANGGAPSPVAHDQVFEAVDLVHDLIGPINRVFATTHPAGALVACATTARGVPVSLAFCANGPDEAVGLTLEIKAVDGTTLHIDRDGRLLCANGAREVGTHQTALGTLDPVVELGYQGLVAEFRRCIQSSGANPGLAGHMDAVVAATEAVLKSISRGRPVTPKSSLDHAAASSSHPMVAQDFTLSAGDT